MLALCAQSQPKIEVIGTTHPTAGVKRLVKAVVRGLNACQVCSVCATCMLGAAWAGLRMAGPRASHLIVAALQEPEASVDGLGGTYFFMNELGERVAIVKPCDEEPLAPNNPKASSFSVLKMALHSIM